MDVLGLSCCAGVGVSVFMGTFELTAQKRCLPTHKMSLPTLDTAIKTIPGIRSLAKREEARALRGKVLVQMPTLLDIVTLGLSAGLSFDASLDLYCLRFKTELAEEFRKALMSWRIGCVDRIQALNAMADHLDIAALRRFSSAVSEALTFGSPLAESLERQAEVIREEQRAQVEEEMEKVPVKMLIPLGTLIVPAMLLAILGPLLGSAVSLR